MCGENPRIRKEIWENERRLLMKMVMRIGDSIDDNGDNEQLIYK